MRTREELERFFTSRPAAPLERGTIDLIVVRVESGKHLTPAGAQVTLEDGLSGDRWAKGWGFLRDVHRQMTLMMTLAAEAVCNGQPLDLPGDNLLVNLDLGAETLPAGSRLRAGRVLLEVTRKSHLGCKKFARRFGDEAMQWVNDEAGRARRLRGLNCRVLEPGELRVGDPIEVVSR